MKKTIVLTFSAIMTCICTQRTYDIKIFTGPDIEKHISYITDMRIKEFRPYPYLYEGTHEYEIEYLKLYARWSHTAIAIAYDNNVPVGFLTGTALTDFDEHFTGSSDLFKKAGFDPANFYYFGEVIINPSHRGKGLARKLFEALEPFARSKHFTHFCLATVVRDENHPLKPTDCTSSDPLWQSMGYQKTDMVVHFDWPTIQSDGSVKDQSNPLVYWVKETYSGEPMSKRSHIS